MGKAKKLMTFCQHCHMKCRLFVTVKDNRIESIKNAMGIPGIKAIHSAELLDHPARVIYPMRRRGKKGGGSWSRITWDEALSIMSERLSTLRDRFGPDAIGTALGCGHKEMAYYATFLFSHVVGSPNVVDINRQCSIPTMVGSMLTFGEGLLTELEPDFLRSRCILLWGANPKHTYPPLDFHILSASRRGAKIIVVDPRPPESVVSTERPVDIWLRIRPGTDAFLALAMIRALIQQGLYDKDFVQDWCTGFEQLKDHVRDYTLERAEEVTQVPKEEILKAATLFSKTQPSCLYTRLGSSAQHVNATQTARALAILCALGGNIDVPGGNLLVNPLGGYRHQRTMCQMPVLPSGIEERRYGADRFPFICRPRGKLGHFLPLRRAHGPDCIEAILRGELKALYVPGCNLLVSESDTRRLWEALVTLDLLVVVDLFMTPTAELADLVLPAAHFLETELPMRAYQRMGPNLNSYILASRKVVDPRGECWDDRKIVFALARRMNVEIPWYSVEEFNDWTLERVGVTFRELQGRRGQQLAFPVRYQKYKSQGFKTPTGKIELYSDYLRGIGFDPLPSYKEPARGAYGTDLKSRYPLILISHRDVHYMHSEFRQLPSLRRAYPEPLLEMNPATADDLGIEEGDTVWIETPGFQWSVRGTVKLLPGLHPQTVSMVSHWWFPEKEGPEHGCFESNINAILSHGPPYDPFTGAHQSRAIPCRVRREPSPATSP